MRAAIYARYSSDLQSENSIEDQVRLCRDYASAQDQAVVQVYTDHAISGGSLVNRPGIQALLADAGGGKFDLVVVEALDRLSRDQEDIAGIYKRLAYNDVAIHTLAEGDVNELHVGLKGTMNALFLKDLAQKTRRGQRGRVEAGKIPGGKSYGYRIVRRILEDGSVSTGEREVEENEAAIVRRIFEEYASGMAPRQIAARLNRENTPSPRGGQWNASTINGNRQRRNGILNNELYIGFIVYNRQRFTKNPETGKRVARLNPTDEWVVKEAPAFRIIDDDRWEKVQALKSRHASRWGNKRQTKKRLLSGLLRCGLCGGGMTLSRGDRYYCSAKREKGTCDANRGIGAAATEERVMNGLRDILLDRDDLLDEFVGAFKAELALLRSAKRRTRQKVTRELQSVRKGIERCLAFITGGDGDPGLVRDELRKLEARKKELEAEAATSDRDTKIDVHPNLAELYRKKVAELQTLLQNEVTKPQAVEIVRSLIEKVEVYPKQERGQCDVILVGALAQVLAYTQKASTAASGGDGGTSLMVAGAGFEPATFRL